MLLLACLSLWTAARAEDRDVHGLGRYDAQEQALVFATHSAGADLSAYSLAPVSAAGRWHQATHRSQSPILHARRRGTILFHLKPYKVYSFIFQTTSFSYCCTTSQFGTDTLCMQVCSCIRRLPTGNCQFCSFFLSELHLTYNKPVEENVLWI